jgi:hypothetical protein
MLRYLGFYSNVCQGRRKKQGMKESEYVIEGEEYNKGANKSWARLLKEVTVSLLPFSPVINALFFRGSLCVR